MKDEPFIQVKLPKEGLYRDLAQRFSNVVTFYGTRQTMEIIGERFRREVSRYIPVGKTHRLQRKAYTLTTGRAKAKGKNGVSDPWFKLEYHNTEEVPYAMYQYYGEVWGPNYATWQADITLQKKASDTKIAWKHTGWVSKAGEKKRNMHRPLGVKRRIELKRSGKVIYIDGYTKRKPRPHPKWVEYFVTSNRYELWLTGTVNTIVPEVVRMYEKKYGKK